MKKLLLVMLVITFSGQMFSQQLVYKPRNPNFGGDTFNYQWLLSSAESQNTFEDPNAEEREEASDLERFTDNLNSQLLNLVSRSLFTDQFGDGGLTPGTYTFGSLSIEIFPSSDGLVITILDTDTGEQTQVIIPD
jgi:curli production assembly/transport component CsgF